MKYHDLIQFDPIDEIIKFGQLDSEDYRAKLVKISGITSKNRRNDVK